MIYIILLGYVLPLIITALIHYFDEGVITVGDFFKYWWAIFIPVFNIFTAIFVPLHILFTSGYFKNLSNKKLWK